MIYTVYIRNRDGRRRRWQLEAENHEDARKQAREIIEDEQLQLRITYICKERKCIF